MSQAIRPQAGEQRSSQTSVLCQMCHRCPRSTGPGRARLLSDSLAWDVGGRMLRGASYAASLSCLWTSPPCRPLWPLWKSIPRDPPPEPGRAAESPSASPSPSLWPFPSRLCRPLSSPWRLASRAPLMFSAWFPPPACAHDLVFSPRTEPTPDVRPQTGWRGLAPLPARGCCVAASPRDSEQSLSAAPAPLG